VPNSISYSIGTTPHGATAKTVTVPPPAYSRGDLLIMCAAGGVATPRVVHPSPPSGWTALSASRSAFGVFYKTATASEPSSYTVTFSAPCAAEAFVIAYPPCTIASSLFANSRPDVVTYTPAFPAGVASGDLVLLFAKSIDNGPTTSGLHNMNVPSGWTPAVYPFGASNDSISGSYEASCISVAEFQGSTSNPTLTSTQASTFYTGFVVLAIPAPADILAVTATAGGAVDGVSGTSGYQGIPAPGMALTVTAVTGTASVASIVSGGATAVNYTAGASGTPHLAITPNATGSWVFGALMDWQPGTAYTAASNTTFSQNVHDAVNRAGYGTFRSTGTTTEGTEITLGATAPSNTRINIALAEILAGGTLATSSAVTATGTALYDFTASAVEQTAIFTSQPPAGSLLVATVSVNSSFVQGGSVTMSLADTSGLTWTALAESNAESGAYAGVWVAQIPASTSMTVTATQGGSANADGMMLALRVLTGAAAAGSQTGTTDTSVTVTTPELSITPSATGSFVYGAITAFGESSAFTAAPSTTFFSGGNEESGEVTYGTFRMTTPDTTTAGTAETVGASAPTGYTPDYVQIALAEILEASGGPGLAEDVSTPAIAYTTTETVTTPSFNPPPGALLVAIVAPGNTGASGNQTITISSTPSVTWTELIAISSSGDAATGIWIAEAPGNAATMGG
jgi:hypothetical protein